MFTGVDDADRRKAGVVGSSSNFVEGATVVSSLNEDIPSEVGVGPGREVGAFTVVAFAVPAVEGNFHFVAGFNEASGMVLASFLLGLLGLLSSFNCEVVVAVIFVGLGLDENVDDIVVGVKSDDLCVLVAVRAKFQGLGGIFSNSVGLQCGAIRTEEPRCDAEVLVSGDEVQDVGESCHFIFLLKFGW